MRFCAIALVLLCGACDHAASRVTAPVAATASLEKSPDLGCWLMNIDGAESRAAVIELKTFQDLTESEVRWRYSAGTDSIYASLGRPKLKYSLWLQRMKTDPPSW